MYGWMGKILRVDLTKEQGEHQGRLERPDTAAGFVNAHLPRADLNDVAVLECGDFQPAEDLDREAGVQARKAPDDRILDEGGPGNRDEEEADREDKI